MLADNGNNFTGPLPGCLRNCSGLTRLCLDGNQFTADITAKFGVYPKLFFISLGNKPICRESVSRKGRVYGSHEFADRW